MGGPNLVEREVYDALTDMGVAFAAQYQVRRWIFDAYLPTLGVVIEVLGDYWHCNPAVYPNGPVDAVQQKNIERDERKRRLFDGSSVRLVMIWEHDIRREGAKALLERELDLAA